MKAYYILIILSILISKNSISQTIDADFKKRANEYYINADYDKAIEMYSQIVASEDKNLNAWVRLSGSYIKKKDYDRAFYILQIAVTKGDNPNLWYNLSAIYGRKNMKEKSIESLRKAITNGFASSDQTMKDEGFASFVNDKDFLSVVEEMKKQEFPCRYNERLKEFEFWVGEWNVYTTLGAKAGQSKIEKILDECVILENWESGNGRKGKSFNTINSNTGDWEQTWVDDFGTVTEFKRGKYSNGALSFNAEGKGVNGAVQYQKLTFFKNDDGTVRQVGEASSNGKEWQITYALLYKRK